MIFKRKKKRNINKYENNKYIGNLESNRMFNNTMEFLIDLIKNEDKDNCIMILNYVLEVIKKDLEYSMITEIIYKEEKKELNSINKISDYRIKILLEVEKLKYNIENKKGVPWEHLFMM